MHSSTCLLLILFQSMLFLAIQPAKSNCLMRWQNDDRQRTETVQSNRPSWQPNPPSWQPNRSNGQLNHPNVQPNRPNWQPVRQKTTATFVPPSAPPQFEIHHGRPRQFCNLFGCDCTPPAGARCCTGYRYDGRSRRCRELKGV